MKTLLYCLGIFWIGQTSSFETNMPPSTSEDHAMAILTESDQWVYSVGISTGGVAEMRMAELSPHRQIIATTIDAEGAKFAQQSIRKKGFPDQVVVKIEDVSQSLPYPDESFDFIYARLVLHYLTKAQLAQALSELHRILKSQGKLFVVVRSTECHEANSPNSRYDPATGFTTYTSAGVSYSRYFHTEKSIQDYLVSHQFSITQTQSYKEQLYVDFQRTKPASQVDSLIEVIASK